MSDARWNYGIAWVVFVLALASGQTYAPLLHIRVADFAERAHGVSVACFFLLLGIRNELRSRGSHGG
jgi:hypothetical protein